VSGDRACLVARAGRESGRESLAKGVSEQGEVGERGAGSKGAGACRGGQRTRGRGREVRDGLTGGDRGAERERACAKRSGADRSAPHSSERERGREEVRGLAPTGGVCLSGTEGARARARARGWA
jgi:hypothetical protein